MSVYEEPYEILREDGVVRPGRLLTPDTDAAITCNGAGVIVLGGEWGLGAVEDARLVRPLAELGYFVIALDLIGGAPATTAEEAARRAADLDPAAAIDDLVGAVLTLRPLAMGRLGVIGIGAAGAIALEAATLVPRLDAVVVVDGPVPARTTRYARLRAAVQLHRATEGTLITADDTAWIERKARRAKPQILVEEYPTQDGFFLRPRDDDEAFHGRVASDKLRDFLSYALIS